jgi:hypothetical protein
MHDGRRTHQVAKVEAEAGVEAEVVIGEAAGAGRGRGQGGHVDKALFVI